MDVEQIKEVEQQPPSPMVMDFQRDSKDEDKEETQNNTWTLLNITQAPVVDQIPAPVAPAQVGTEAQAPAVTDIPAPTVILTPTHEPQRQVLFNMPPQIVYPPFTRMAECDIGPSDVNKIKRAQAFENLSTDIVRKTRVVRSRQSPPMPSKNGLIFMTLLCFLLNPVVAPAGIYFLIRSQIEWSRKNFNEAERLSHRVNMLALAGISMTIITFIIVLLVMIATQSRQSIPSKSNIQQDLAENCVKKKRPRHHSNLHLRNGKRTSKARNNRRRFKNRQIDDLNNMIRQITPTESPKSNRAQHFSAVLNNNMAKGKIRRIFRNETLFVYFDPKSNKTKNVNILDFLQ